MIIAKSADEFRCITQHEHGKIAGQCAVQWGNGEFESPRPNGSVATATFTHDIGWHEFDQRPRLTADEQTDPPTLVNFHQLPAQTWIEMYEQGIDAVADLDPYAGLVVSLHGVGLRNRRYGLAPGWNAPRAVYQDFIRREQERQRQLIEQIATQGNHSVSDEDRATLKRLHEDAQDPERYSGRLWCNYKLLQVWDTLSHILCATVDQSVETAIEHTPVSSQTDVRLEVHSEEANTYRVDPYPFVTDPLVIPAVARTVSEQTVASGDEQAIAREYFANTDTVDFRIHS